MEYKKVQNMKVCKAKIFADMNFNTIHFPFALVPCSQFSHINIFLWEAKQILSGFPYIAIT